MSELAKALGPMMRRIGNMLARGSIASVNAANKMQGLQVRLLAGEVKDGVEHFEPYGFTAHPLGGAEALAAFFDGDRSHGVVFCVADRRYRLTSLAAGEVALYTWKNAEAHGHRIIFKNDGSIEVAAKNITVKAEETARIEGDVVEIHAASLFQFDCNGHGQKWLPTKIDTWQIGEVAGTPNAIAPPEIP